MTVAELLRVAHSAYGLAPNGDRVAHLRRVLEVEARPGGRPEPDRLVQQALNGETYFFRYPYFLQVLAERYAQGPAETPFRVLSAACSTGEEAWSAAFALAETGGRRPFEVVGHDVRERAIAAARRAVYGRWSLRGTDDARLARWFEPTDDQRRSVRAEVRARVRFAVANLLDPVGDGPYDVVLLCNATLYMHEAAAQQAYRNVAAALQPGGLLMIAPTDPTPDPALFAHRPEHSGWSIFSPARESGATATAAPRPVRPEARSDRPPAPRPGPPAVRPSGAPAPSAAGDAVVRAWREGRLSEVAAELRRRVFFEPRHPLWRFLYGALLREQGWLGRSQREVSRAEELLDASDDATLAAGCTAADLRAAIRAWRADHG